VRSLQWQMVLISGLVLAAQCGAKPLVTLRELAQVSGGTVRLSDLLPAGAPAGMRLASEAVELCRSPQAGSVRVLEAAQIAQALAKQPDLLRQLAIPDRILVRRLGWTIPGAAIREAVGRFLGDQSARALPESALQSPGDMSARQENPALEVAGITRNVRGQGIELRLRCIQRSACSSFVVCVCQPRPWSADLLATRDLTANSLASWHPAPIAARDAGPVLAQAGKRALLLLDSGGMSISLPVTCLQRGKLGQNIRVLDAGSHRILEAQVVGAGKLHASL